MGRDLSLSATKKPSGLLRNPEGYVAFVGARNGSETLASCSVCAKPRSRGRTVKLFCRFFQALAGAQKRPHPLLRTRACKGPASCSGHSEFKPAVGFLG